MNKMLYQCVTLLLLMVIRIRETIDYTQNSKKIDDGIGTLMGFFDSKNI